MHALQLLPLAPLFASLLSGCLVGTSSCDDAGGSYTYTLQLTPEQYEHWMHGVPDGPGAAATSSTGGGAPTTGDVGSTAGEVGTAGDTASDGTTGGASTGTTTGGAMLSDQEICTMVCIAEFSNAGLESCTIGEKTDSGARAIDCIYQSICEGRRHACVRSRGDVADHDPADPATHDPAAAWLARAAHDEAASVHAFTALGRELAAHGAPPALLARVYAAARDEVRHAALIGALARIRGVAPRTLTIVAPPARGLQAIAVENAIEGCVRETWAALSAAHQADHAADAGLRRTYAEIAADEARHAELAWAIDTWLSGQLAPAARAAVRRARAAAVRELRAQLAATADLPALLALGVPPRARALQLAAGLDSALWSRAA